MKKRILALVLAVNCTVFMTACGDSEKPTVNEVRDTASKEDTSSVSDAASETDVLTQNSDSEENAAEDDNSEQSTQDDTEEIKEETKASSSNASATLSDDLYDFQISIDGTVYQFPMWYSDFEALGWEYDGDKTETLSSNQYATTQRWKKDNYPVYTVLANMSINTAAFSDSMVAGITLSKYDFADCDWEIILPGGIQWGVSNADDIKAAYGDPSSDYDGTYYYDMTYKYDYYREIKLSVDKETGALAEVRIENIIEFEGADNSVSTEVPDVIKDYQAPTELGNDLYSFNVEFEGNLYTLPCPVTEFLANGFTIDESNSEMEVASGNTGLISLRYNNQTLRARVKNFADYATTIENCMLIKLESSEYGPDFTLIIPGNIKRGDSEDVLKKAIADYNVEESVSSSGYIYYHVYNPDGSSLDRYSICVQEGVITTIEVSNSQKPE